MRKKIVKHYKKSVFFQNLTKVFTGNVFAQLILVGISPLLTRVYSPSDFGVYGGYASLLGIFLVISSCAYEKAIPIEKKTVQSYHLILLCLLISTLFFILGIGIYLTVGWSVFNLINLSVSFWLPILFSIGLYAASIQQILNYWSIKKNKFSDLSFSKIYQSSVNVSMQLFFSKLTLSAGVGLVGGDLLGRVVASLYLMSRFAKSKKSKFSWKIMGNQIMKYRKFPLLGTPSLLLNNLSLQLPTLIFISYFGSELSGQFSLAQRTIGMPISMITLSLGQVFYGNASSLVETNRPKLVQNYFKLTMHLTMIFLIPMILFMFFAPHLFLFLFGSNWTLAGKFARILTPMFFSQIIVIPISQILYITNNQLVQLIWDSTRFLLVVVGFMLLKWFDLGIEVSVLFYSISMTFSYVLLYLLGIKSLQK
ncbi:hypothetical protein CKN73_05605 [Carnobacterium divergens]|uniref:lipopolysaccharide biosynthesis protein n=2 Tax=Carnobacterium divergens TaxID=2748 RepID=UPI00107240A4|nr:oligosaccharide flippase family protein [Carnobacterium divergens]TFJ41160.1 hypothetical protein CKN77_05730 [Carnobacterium divergens]TFJ49799.1 hypothetical protein CKN73_05605 [Carnobacterium divergens]TFJ55084.1 hypothetical protein CKN83_05535 [Carnobacterium divergens]TFJ61650.1 hypothetical protein CKN89_05840 [Carnobacterium divergens]TFJ71613.1 hypothetical protein CKN78_05835 [Carnobacterium divergens]